MSTNALVPSRVFKTAWLAKASRKTGISDQHLCAAIEQVMQGQADNLGGGVFKKRLNDNRHRSIILARGDRYWMFKYLFAKQDRDNIDKAELAAFRLLAKRYAGLTEVQVTELTNQKLFMEICNGGETEI